MFPLRLLTGHQEYISRPNHPLPVLQAPGVAAAVVQEVVVVEVAVEAVVVVLTDRLEINLRRVYYIHTEEPGFETS